MLRIVSRTVMAVAALAMPVACRTGAVGPASPSGPQAIADAVGPSSPAFGSKDVDRLLDGEWTAHGITPATPVDDQRFLRRVYLDIIGRIPTLEEIRDYQAYGAVARRSRVVDV